MRDMISRFAPAPTGFLHLGHVVNAVYVWRETRARGGRVLLRIEDHDRQRSRREYEAEILDDLAWLGFVADAPLVRQSERSDIYEHALDGLRRQGLVYACNCSRAEIAKAALKGCATDSGDSRAEIARAALKGGATDMGDSHAEIAKADLKGGATDSGDSRAEIAKAALKGGATDSGDSRAEIAKAALKVGATDSGDSRAEITWAGPPACDANVAPVAQPFRAADDEVRYPGTCRDRGLGESPGVGVRVRLE